MAWSYSGDPGSSPLDGLRFSIGDTDSALPILSDEELLYILIGHNDDVATSTIYAMYAILSKYARLKDETVGGLQARYSQIYEHYRTLIQERLSFNAAANVAPGAIYCGGISIADKQSNDLDDTTVQSKFKKDQNTSRYLQGQYDVWQYRYY